MMIGTRFTRRNLARMTGVTGARALALLCLGFVVLAARPAHAQPQAPQPLSYYKSYFLPGGYTVRGTSLWRKGVNGKAVVSIPRLDSLGGADGVPATADIEAVFLYLQTAERTQGSGVDFGGVHVKFAGIDMGPFNAAVSLEPGDGTFLLPLVEWNSAGAPCWSLNFPGQRRLMTYRADVMRFLPIDPSTRKQALNVPIQIQVPDMGPLFGDDDENSKERSDVMGPRAVGASLVVVYRDDSKPFTGIVLYDGAHTKRAFQTMTQEIKGFYEAAAISVTNPDGPVAKMTHIVGDGRPFLFERVLMGNQQIAINPYIGQNGPKWDNATFNKLPLEGHASSATITVEKLSLLSDCVSFSAMVFSTKVEDPDNDGLITAWETNTNNQLTDPKGMPLPNLGSWGANAAERDLFVHIDWLETGGNLMYGDKLKPAHSHKPPRESIQMIGDEYARNGIHLHVDLGPNGGLNDYYQASPYIIPAVDGGAVGGKSWSETAMCPDGAVPPGPIPVECGAKPMPGQYPQFPGTVGWKSGFRLMRDEILGFPKNRLQTFGYVLAAHFVGIPKDSCLKKNAQGLELFPPQVDQVCAANSADFHVPRTYSGIADYPGGDFLHTVGGFDNEQGEPVGTAFMWASTYFHEKGHNFKLTHGGRDLNTGARLQNCRPQHFTIMNYMYQLHGVQKNDAKALLRLAEGGTDTIFENSLSDGEFNQVPPTLYRMGFYAPKRSSNVNFLAKAATKHCDGTDLSAAEEADRLADGGMVRLNAITAEGQVDWNANGDIGSAGEVVPPSAPNGIQDVDFSGAIETLAGGSNEWAQIRLNELAGRRNVGAYYRDAQGRNAVGPLSLDVGRGDIGRGDIGRGDIGRGDIGRGDIGRGDIGRGDIGRGDIGRGDIGRGDIGRGDIGRGGGDTDVGAADEPFVELDAETARAVSGDSPDPPSGLAACLTSDGSCAPEGGNRPVLLKWDASHFGKVVDYLIYRFEYVGDFAEPTVERLPTESIGSVCSSIDRCDGTVPTEFTDFGAPGGTKLAYFVRTVFEGEEDASDKSNYATITTPPAVLDFDGFGDLTVLTNQYASEGITFTGATFLNSRSAGGSLNDIFPPRSGTGVIFDFGLTFGGVMTVTFTSPVRQAGGYVTGNTAITLTCYDAADNPLGSASTPDANYVGATTGYSPNIFLEVSSPGIASCKFTDHGNSYTVDDFTFRRY